MSGAPVVLSSSNVVGSKCGALFPTGVVQEEIDGVPVTCIDAAMPMVIMRAGDLSLNGYDPDEIAGNAVLMQRVETIRLEAGRRMGFGNVADSVIPKVGILAPPRHGGVVYSCYLTPHHVHATHAVTGAVCVACCVSILATVPRRIARPQEGQVIGLGTCVISTVRVEHPSGTIDVRLETEGDGTKLRVLRAALVLTSRKIMDGSVFLPQGL